MNSFWKPGTTVAASNPEAVGKIRVLILGNSGTSSFWTETTHAAEVPEATDALLYG